MQTRSTGLAADLAKAQARVAAWRSDNNGRRRQLPAWVWTEGAELARIHGVHPVSRALRLRYDKLKALTAAALPSPAVAPANFVEVTAAAVATRGREEGDVTVELTNALGHRMVIRATPSLNVAGLVATFCAGGAA